MASMPSRQGQLILASPSLEDPNFAKAVTLIVEHNDEGALGLILNRPMELSVADALRQSEQSETVCHHTGLLHQGGPCAGPLMVLHTDADKAGIRVGEGLYFSVEAQDVAWLLEHHEGRMKCFVGYSGWGAGQLESELDVGSWLVCQGGAEAVFASGGDQWLDLLRVISPAEAALARNPRLRPSDPRMN